MAWSLTDIQTQIASEIDGNATISTSSADWGSRIIPINRAIRDWSESYDWSALLKVHNGRISTSTGNASYALPSDFKKLDGFPRIMSDGTNAYDFPAVDPSKNLNYTSSDKFVNILGNDRDNRVMFIQSSTLSSGASVQFTYYASPASLVSAYDLTECPDPTFVVQRSLYYLLKSREDGRFPEAKTESDRILARMIENENTLGLSSVDRNIPTSGTKFPYFRIGRD